MSAGHTPMVVAVAYALCTKRAEEGGVEVASLWILHSMDFLKEAAAAIEISGAADLLAALESIIENSDDDGAIECAHAAVAKATGAQP